MRVPLLAETSLAAQQLGDEFIVRDVVACICVDEKTVRERGAPDLGQNRYLQSYGKQMDPTGRRELDSDGGDAQPAAGRGSLVRHPRHRGPESSASDTTATNSAADIPTAAVEPPVIELCHPTRLTRAYPDPPADVGAKQRVLGPVMASTRHHGCCR